MVLNINIDLEVLVNLCFTDVFELASHLKLKLFLHFKLCFEFFADLKLFLDLDLTVSGGESVLKTAIFVLVKIALTVLRLSWAVSRAVTTDAAETASVTGQVFVINLVLVEATNSALIESRVIISSSVLVDTANVVIVLSLIREIG